MPPVAEPDQSTVPSGNWFVRHPLTAYFLLTFTISWLLLIPGVLTYYKVLNLPMALVGPMAMTSLLGPILSGLVMTALTAGRAGVAEWLAKIVRWRVSLIWYVFALIIAPLVIVACTLVWPGAFGAYDRSAHPFTVAYLTAFISMAVMGGPLCEEPGWTGFAQPRLQERYGALIGGLILGFLWALWHLPGFLIPSQGAMDIPPRGTVFDFALFTVALMGLRLVIMWVVNNTRMSVLMAILVHASWNTFYVAGIVKLFPAAVVLGSYRNLTLAGVAMALVIVVATRGRLGMREPNRVQPSPAPA